MLKTKCSKCSAKIDYEESEAGTPFTCDCGTAVDLPAPEKKAATPPPPMAPPPPTVYCSICRVAPALRRTRSRRPMCQECLDATIARNRSASVFSNMTLTSGLLAVFGIVDIITGIVLFVILMHEQGPQPANLPLPGACVVSGLLLVAAGQALNALRIIAINSGKQLTTATT